MSSTSTTSAAMNFSFARPKPMESKIVIKNNLLDELDQYDMVPADCKHSKHYLLTDSQVDTYYGDKVLEKLEKLDLNVTKLVIPEGEESKTLDVLSNLANQVLTKGIDKRSIIFSLGGGVINNIAGFLAACLYRGIALVHFPTSMMAQVDAAIDFKQAVNMPQGKNLMGAFHPASFIMIDPTVLTTLTRRHVVNGISESIKHALGQDASFFHFLLDNAHRVHEASFLEKVVATTVELKCPLLNGGDSDYLEMCPQYGHCIGHALEKLSNFSLAHGEGISIGMCVSAEIAYILGLCDLETVAAHYSIFSKYQLPVVVPSNISTERIAQAIQYDKHYVQKLPTMALPKAIGVLHDVEGVYGRSIPIDLMMRALSVNRKRETRPLELKKMHSDNSKAVFTNTISTTE